MEATTSVAYHPAQVRLIAEIETLEDALVLKEFKAFAMRGNVVDIVAGIVIGIALGTVIDSLVTEVIMPPIGLLMGGINVSELFVVLKEGAVTGPYATLAQAREAGAVAVGYGVFMHAAIGFLLVIFAILPLLRAVNNTNTAAGAEKSGLEANTKECAFCFSRIPAKAIRCPSCTSELCQTAIRYPGTRKKVP